MEHSPGVRTLTTLSKTDALVAVAFCAAYADGTLEPEEAESFAEHLSDCHALAGCDDDAIQDAVMRAEAISEKEGDDALLTHAAAALPPPLRETAFCLAADLVLADGEIASEERAFLEQVRKRLGVQDTLASRIVEVMLIRNRA